MEDMWQTNMTAGLIAALISACAQVGPLSPPAVPVPETPHSLDILFLQTLGPIGVKFSSCLLLSRGKLQGRGILHSSD